MIIRVLHDVNARNSSGNTLLHVATQNNQKSIVKLLLNIGADVNIAFLHNSPLYTAISNNSTEIVELLLTRLQTVTKEELFKAVKNDNTQIVQLLLPKITNIDINAINYSGRTELHIASSDGNINMVKFLLQHQANPNTKDNRQKTPLKSAIYHGHLNIVKLLFDHKAHDDLTHLLVTAVVNDHNKIVKFLLEEKNANSRNAECNATPLLHVMITKGNIDIVKMLIKHGDNVNVVYHDEYPIDVAIREEQYQILEYLLEHKDKMGGYFMRLTFLFSYYLRQYIMTVLNY
ncbi:MAG: ankyrin repeat domain-containing protein [Candidatus Tisiphia sp.]